MPSQIVSGYCKCSFPASTRCPKCGIKLCGNCVGKHKCKTEEPVLVPTDAVLEIIANSGQSETVKAAVRKPYGPRVKK